MLGPQILFYKTYRLEMTCLSWCKLMNNSWLIISLKKPFCTMPKYFIVLCWIHTRFTLDNWADFGSSSPLQDDLVTMALVKGWNLLGISSLARASRIKPWVLMTLLLGHHLSFFGPRLEAFNHCIPGTPHRTCCFGNVLTQSSCHPKLALVKVTQLHTSDMRSTEGITA